MGYVYDGQRDYDSMESYLITQYKKDERIHNKESYNVNEDGEEKVDEVPVNILDEKNFNDFISKGFHFIS